MSLETLKTVGGYLVTLLDRYTPFNLAGNSIEKIYNYLPITEMLRTSGQPSEEQLMLIQQAEFDVVINLAPNGVENSLQDEHGSVARLGMEYHHIPVDFKNPKKEDYAQFVKTMNACQSKKVWVHCAANMRVSVFMYLYRCEIFGESPVEVKKDLRKIWKPFGVWQDFMQKMERKAQRKSNKPL